MKKIHFIGIGGIGMSALAEIELTRGSIVSGSDLRPNSLTDKLSKKGAKICKGHFREHLSEDTDLVVRSACIREGNAEIIKAKELSIPVIPRAEMLRAVIEETPFSIGVTGTHGKTTTSTLLAHIAEYCGEDPTVVVGGESCNFGGNAKTGRSGMIIAEIDESDGYFKNIGTTCAVVTNIDREHMETYGTFENLTAAYSEFISRISPSGFFVFNGEDKVATCLADMATAKKISFGVNGNFDVTCIIEKSARSIEFDLFIRGHDHGKVLSSLIGRYNVMNILAAIAVSVETGFDVEQIIGAVNSFRGVRRRFDPVGKAGSVEVIEDYAHHPTELRSVIAAAQDYSSGRVVTVFQPHRYSRTYDMKKEFSDCFYDADVLILTDIYSADEDEIKEISANDICRAMDEDKFELLDCVDKGAVIDLVTDIVKAQDTILVLGAGDIREIALPLVKALRLRDIEDNGQ